MSRSELINELIKQLNEAEDSLLIGLLRIKISQEKNYSLKFTKSERSNAMTGLAKTLQSELINIGVLKKDKRFKDSSNLGARLDKKSKVLKVKLVDEIVTDDTFNNLVECKILINKIQRKLQPYKYRNRYDAS